MDPVTDIDIKKITKIAERLSDREEFILNQQQWRSPLDRQRAFVEKKDAKLKWIKAATETHEAVEKAKQDCENDKAKLEILASKVIALQPENITSQTSAKLRFEYISQVSDATQALLDMVNTGVKGKIDAAVQMAKDTVNAFQEMAKSKGVGVNPWVITRNQGRDPAMAFKNLMLEVIRELYPNKIGGKLSESETANVSARLVGYAGGSSKLYSFVTKLKNTSMIRAVVISLAIIINDIINAAFDDGPVKAITTAISGVVGTGAGIAAGIAAESFIASSTLAAAGPATMAVLGVLGGAIAGFVVGAAVVAILDVIIDLFMGVSENSYTHQWQAYLNSPIVYRVVIAD